MDHIRLEELLDAGDRVGLAVSGGIDSVALLRLLIELRQELGIVLFVVHFNHRLRGAESDSDQAFVAALAREHGLEFYCASGDVAQLAAERHSGVEAAARELRYGFFGELLGGAALPQSFPQGLKPESVEDRYGTAEAVPFPISTPATAKAVPFPISTPATAEAVPFPISTPATTDAVPFPGRPLNKIATAHTLDDQAETVLMRLIRGTGMHGLSGIYPRLVVEHEDGEGFGEIVRPLLGIRRGELERYLADLKQPWREDSSNADCRFTRNRVRSMVLPLLEREFNPAVVESLGELAQIARDEEDYWENELSGWLGTVVQWSQPEWMRGLVQIQPAGSMGPNAKAKTKGVVETRGGANASADGQEVLRSAQDDSDLRLGESGPALANASVSRAWLLTEPTAVQRRVLKAIGEEAGIPLEFKHIEEMLRFAAEDGPSGKALSLPLGWKLVREPEAMVFVAPDARRQEQFPDYEYGLSVPGRVLVPELGVVIEALSITPESQFEEYNSQQLLRAELLPRQLTVRNWRPGDRFWPAHTKAPKKIKELLQERHVAQPERRLWPVVANGDEIVWMRDFPVPAKLCAKAGQEAVLIRVLACADEGHSV